MEKCKYCVQDERGYHEMSCPITQMHELYGIAQDIVGQMKELEAENKRLVEGKGTLIKANIILLGCDDETNFSGNWGG